ncbi:MAG: phosphoribosylanthranilate isomerase [Chitinophagaceae bacterium]|nr:MAG: phosphoribosylanthranilate isomerase [Chitinophagaceae bacterium]
MNDTTGNQDATEPKRKTRIKVCGMTLPEQVNALDEMGVDLAGFIFYPRSPRYMADKLSPDKIKKIGGRIAKVGVFVNAQYDEMMRTVEEYRLDMVQLHGDETPFYCEKVANYVSVIKAFRLTDDDPIDWITRPFHDTCDMYMFDTMGAGYGGTGKKFDWDVLNQATMQKLFFLSGGIEPGDGEKLKTFETGEAGTKLFAIDINSRFEVSPGVKDMTKVREFVQQVKGD